MAYMLLSAVYKLNDSSNHIHCVANDTYCKQVFLWCTDGLLCGIKIKGFNVGTVELAGKGLDIYQYFVLKYC